MLSVKMQQQMSKVLLCFLVCFGGVSCLESGGTLTPNAQMGVAYSGTVSIAPTSFISYSRPGSPQQPLGAILKQQSEVNPDGSYQWSYETEDGIKAEESGTASDVEGPSKVATGSFEYTSPDGTPIRIEYIADANGFVAKGAHLPIAPPIPVQIARALEWNAAHPQKNQ